MANSNSNTDSNIENKLPIMTSIEEKLPSVESIKPTPTDSLSQTTVKKEGMKSEEPKVLPEEIGLPLMSLQHSDTFPALPNAPTESLVKQLITLDQGKYKCEEGKSKEFILQEKVLDTMAGKKVDI